MTVRFSGPTLRLLKQMLQEPKRKFSGYELSKACGIGSGTMYPLLARLERAELIEGVWEEVEPSEVGRPRRRYYLLTRLGQRKAAEELNRFQVPGGLPQWSF